MVKKVIFYYFVLGIWLALGHSICAQNSHLSLPVPHKAQLAWQEAELGVVFHYDLHVFDEEKYGQGNNRINPVLNYNIFNPEELDTDQWIRAAKAMGAKFAILTATHETGFALYQSDVNPYCLKAIKWRDGKGDIVQEFVNSCRKYDIEPGIYLGIRWNSFFGVHNFVVNGEGEFQKNRQLYYNRMVEGMVEEICTRYGELFEIWFDGGADHPDRGAPDVLPIVKKYQPTCLFYHNSQLAEARWGGSESGTVNYPCWATFPYPSVDQTVYKEINQNNFSLLKSGDPDGKYWMPAMSDAPLRGFNGRHEWFWEPGDEKNIFPLSKLLEMYYKSVGRNSTLILGLTPNPDGLMPEPDVQRLREFGEEIDRRFKAPLASTFEQENRTELLFNEETIINHLILEEDIVQGERVREFVIECKIKDKWEPIVKGSCIGQKYITKIDDTKVSGIRLKVLRSSAPVAILDISVYNVIENPVK
ncbi:MAG: alpha-L-fucosidase [Bacteroidales bacterium]|nr:alpha-L-fucosidase [Bacteroidales bacterium]